jgi:hypothetical protein
MIDNNEKKDVYKRASQLGIILGKLSSENQFCGEFEKIHRELSNSIIESNLSTEKFLKLKQMVLDFDNLYWKLILDLNGKI